MSVKEFIQLSKSELSQNDFELESTAQSLTEFANLVETIELKNTDKMLDIGCGAGGFTNVISRYFDIDETHGIDINPYLLNKAENHNIITHNIDIEKSSLPFNANSIPFVVCLGTLEHLSSYDKILSEIKRILTKTGVVIFALPNLGSWVNRASLLGGWQPRNVEISTKKTTNIAPWHANSEEVLGHKTTPTYNAFTELLEYYDYSIIDSKPLFPYQDSFIVKLIDNITKYRVQLARRVAFTVKIEK